MSAPCDHENTAPYKPKRDSRDDGEEWFQRRVCLDCGVEQFRSTRDSGEWGSWGEDRTPHEFEA